MSSPEEDYNDGDSAQNAKKRRIQRACDMCRRKKSTLPITAAPIGLDVLTAPAAAQSDVRTPPVQCLLLRRAVTSFPLHRRRRDDAQQPLLELRVLPPRMHVHRGRQGACAACISRAPGQCSAPPDLL